MICFDHNWSRSPHKCHHLFDWDWVLYSSGLVGGPTGPIWGKTTPVSGDKRTHLTWQYVNYVNYVEQNTKGNGTRSAPYGERNHVGGAKDQLPRTKGSAAHGHVTKAGGVEQGCEGLVTLLDGHVKGMESSSISQVVHHRFWSSGHGHPSPVWAWPCHPCRSI